MLILLPPSEGKNQPTSKAQVNLAKLVFPKELIAIRGRLLTKTLASAPAAKAMDVYTGTLYQALDGLAADLIIDCRSSTYAGVWQSPPANTVAVRVFKKERGKISVITHLSKKYRGELTRVLLKAGKAPKTPSELLAIAKKHFDCKLQKPKGNLPWCLDLIIN